MSEIENLRKQRDIMIWLYTGGEVTDDVKEEAKKCGLGESVFIEYDHALTRARKAFAPLWLALVRIAKLGTSQTDSPAQCGAVLIAMDALNAQEKECPTCGQCNVTMTPENSKLRPELFLCDECWRKVEAQSHAEVPGAEGQETQE